MLQFDFVAVIKHPDRKWFREERDHLTYPSIPVMIHHGEKSRQDHRHALTHKPWTQAA